MKTRFVAILVATCVVMTGSLFAAGQDLVSRGQRMLSVGRFEKAAAYFKAAIIRDVTDDAAWSGYRKAVVGMEKGTAPAPAPVKVVKPAPPQPVTPDIAPLPPTPAAIKPTLAPKPGSLSLDDLSFKLGGQKPKQPSTPGSQYSVDSTQITPWKGLSVFEEVDWTLLDSPNRAKSRFMDERKKLTRGKRNRAQTGVEAIVTYYTKRLYKYLAVHMGSQKGWSYKHTEMQFVLMSKFARRYHEFAIDIREASSPRKFPYVEDIAKRTSLKDDAGNTYKVVKHAGPSQKYLKKVDTYSVCFPLKDKDGTPIVDKAKKFFYLIIKGLDNSRDVKRIAFPKEIFKRP